MKQNREKRDVTGKIAAVMEAICDAATGLSIREIEKATEIPRSTVHRLLASLEEEEWVCRDDDGYRPGLRFFLLHNENAFYSELIRISTPIMRKLMERGERTVIMCVLEGEIGRCIYTVEPPTAVKFVAHKGMTVPLHAGATGKTLLAHCRSDIRNRILEGELPALTSRTIIDPKILRRELEEIRERGYAFSQEEWITHAGDLSLPIFDRNGRFVAQLGIAGVASSFDGQVETLLPMVSEAAKTISNML